MTRYVLRPRNSPSPEFPRPRNSPTIISSPSTASYSEASAALGVLPVGGGATVVTDEDGVTTVTANIGLKGPAAGAAQFSGKVVGPTYTVTLKTLSRIFN